MPFKSTKQRKLFYAAANNPEIRKKMGITKKEAEKMIKDSEHKKKK